MKVSDVQIGKVYTAKVTHRIVPVRLDATHPSGGWKATNLATGKQVRIKSPAKLRNEVPPGSEALPATETTEDHQGNGPGESTKQVTRRSSPKRGKVRLKAVGGHHQANQGEDGDPSGPSPDESRDDSHADRRSKASSSSRRRGRVALTTHGDRAALEKGITDLAPSQDHIAFARNGKVYELYFRTHNGSPAVWKAPAETPPDDEGYRSNGAALLVTGVTPVTQTIKLATGKRPSQLRIRLGNWARTQKTKASATSASGDGMSLLDAAAKVLSEARGKPLSCREMMERIQSKGYWSPARGGKTPAATLSSAVLREMQTKRREARFEKIARGQFTLRRSK